MSLPFLSGARGTAQRQAKVAKLLYGRRHMMVHQELAERPDISSIIVHAAPNEMPALLKSAHVSGELSPDTISDVLRRLKKFARYDKALAVARAYEAAAGRQLRPAHFTQLMSIALAAGEKFATDRQSAAASAASPVAVGWAEAMRLFHRGIVQRRHPLNAAIAGSVLAALRQGGQWERSVGFFTQAVADQVPLESKAVHTLVSHLRRSNKWELALSVFELAVTPPPAVSSSSADADAEAEGRQLMIGAGVQPDYLLYRELLYTVQDAARRGVAGAWALALSIASTIHDVCPPNAGIYNVLIETCAAVPSHKASSSSSSSSSSHWRRQWHAGLAVFQHMQERTLHSALHDGSTRTIVNSGTIDALSALRPTHAAHQVLCHSIARRHGLSVSPRVYRRLFSALDRDGRSGDVAAFVEKMSDDAITDPTNSGLALQPMLLGLFDSLSCHPRPAADALPLAEFLRPTLQPVVATATAGCAAWGDATQTWVLERGCRVAVLDAQVLMISENFEELLMPHLVYGRAALAAQTSEAQRRCTFDAIVIPLTAIRLLIDKMENEAPSSRAAVRARRALAHLRTLQCTLSSVPGTSGGGGAAPVQVLSFVHHLRSLQFAADEFDSVAERENAKARTAELLALDERMQAQQQQQQQDRKAASAARRSHHGASASISVVADDDAAQEGTTGERVASGNDAVPAAGECVVEAAAAIPSTRRYAHITMNPATHSIAAALMLSKLNPDAEVLVVSASSHTTNFCTQVRVRCLDLREVVRVRTRTAPETPEPKSDGKKTLALPGDRNTSMTTRSRAMSTVPASSASASVREDGGETDVFAWTSRRHDADAFEDGDGSAPAGIVMPS